MSDAKTANPAEPMKDEESDSHHMTIWEHLDELRSRLIKMILAFLLGAIISWTQREWLLDFLVEPYMKAWDAGQRAEKAALYFPSPASLFIAYVRLSALAGFVFALPIMLWQLWAFVAPGLYSREKRLAVPFVLSSCGLFALGGYFAWRVVFPVAFQFLVIGMSSGPLPGGLEIKPNVMVPDYLEFVTHMLIAFGAAAELPVLVFFLSIAGIVTHRHLIKFFRYFIVLAFVIAAVLTPPDPMSQLLLAIPLCLLYGLSIGVAYVFSRKKEPEAEP